jgi:hypothetical protein
MLTRRSRCHAPIHDKLGVRDKFRLIGSQEERRISHVSAIARFSHWAPRVADDADGLRRGIHVEIRHGALRPFPCI